MRYNRALMEHPSSPWNDWYGASVYDSYVLDYGIYRALNRRLAELAEIASGSRVLDLACGTGATAASCLRRLPRDATLIGIDGSEAMVGIARSRIQDPRASFLVADAAAVETVVEGPFDRIVCNAAFAHFPSPMAVVRSLSRVAEPGTRLVFNLPAARVSGAEHEIHAFQIALERRLDDLTERSVAPVPSTLVASELEQKLAEVGFHDFTSERFTYRGRQGEFVELMKIPAMMALLAPELSNPARADLVEEAGDNVDHDQPVEVSWIYFSTVFR